MPASAIFDGTLLVFQAAPTIQHPPTRLMTMGDLRWCHLTLLFCTLTSVLARVLSLRYDLLFGVSGTWEHPPPFKTIRSQFGSATGGPLGGVLVVRLLVHVLGRSVAGLQLQLCKCSLAQVLAQTHVGLARVAWVHRPVETQRQTETESE
jgi:hypothetical protein